MTSLMTLPDLAHTNIFSFIHPKELLERHTNICRKFREFILNIPLCYINFQPNLHCDPFNRLGQRISKVKITEETLLACRGNRVALFAKNNMEPLYNSELTQTPISTFESFINMGILRLYTGDHQGVIHCYSCSLHDRTWRQIEDLKGHKTTITALNIFNNNLFSTATDGNICIWRLKGEIDSKMHIVQKIHCNQALTTLRMGYVRE